MSKADGNIDRGTVEGFGDEWSRFDQSTLQDGERRRLFDSYFAIFPWEALPPNPVGFDLGCGSGRWAKLAASRVGHLHCMDPSDAIEIARFNLSDVRNCEFHRASVDSMPLADKSMDFGYALGVLHHVPDTEAGIRACVKKLKLGAPFLIYLYYAFDNRPWWYRMVWRGSDVIRQNLSRLPHGLRYPTSQVLAALVYYPLARGALLAEMLGADVSNFPLSAYRRLSFYTMRTDALDRFGTRLEQRFSRSRIAEMMQKAGLERIVFSETEPFWCAVGFRARSNAKGLQ